MELMSNIIEDVGCSRHNCGHCQCQSCVMTTKHVHYEGFDHKLTSRSRQTETKSLLVVVFDNVRPAPFCFAGVRTFFVVVAFYPFGSFQLTFGFRRRRTIGVFRPSIVTSVFEGVVVVIFRIFIFVGRRVDGSGGGKVFPTG
uniref:Uncharacterized protein n=1 Tax=Romanomermis culicivorax TaxID=13658 RepID=A0A915K6G6_ROMCU